ncbi:DUF1822 family protein [Microcoleus anatoxicus]|uniref:DUF1822 family protein n=1 Tax=Microcoleus anatoxicus PTRS2 TaxID=2705321 RepID=A0ABU8YNA2_9CYAN
MKLTDHFNLTIQLTKKAHNDAHKFASKQANSQKVKQVYLNTLAVYAVQDFLNWLGIETDLNAGDSWHSVVRCFQNVADLVIPNLGKLECRPVLPGQTVISLPPEVTEDRIAYIGVQFQEQLNEVQLLGFYPTIDPQAPLEEIEIASLQPIETLIDYIDRLESAHFFLPNEEVAIKVRDRLAIQSISEIITQLERIYRTYNKYERRYAGGEFLASYLPTTKGVSFRGVTPVADREEFDDSQQRELQDLAEELLEKLDEIWGDDSSDQLVDSESLLDEICVDYDSDSVDYDSDQLFDFEFLIHESIPQIKHIEQPVIVPLSQPQAGLINLSEWLQNPEGSQYHWQPLELFLSNQEGNLIFRFASAPRSRSADAETPTRSVSKVREIPLPGHPLVLIINCQLESDGRRDILVRLYPSTEEQTYLPQGVQLIILDESGEVFLEAQSRSADNWIQLEFRGEAGEPFSIKVVFGDLSVTDNFAI